MTSKTKTAVQPTVDLRATQAARAALQHDTRSELEKQMTAIEREHFGQCLWQAHPGDRTVVEAFHYPKAKTYAVVVKHFDGKVRGARTWPKMTACEVFLPADESNTFAGLETALAEREAGRQEKTRT